MSAVLTLISWNLPGMEAKDVGGSGGCAARHRGGAEPALVDPALGLLADQFRQELHMSVGENETERLLHIRWR